MKRLNKNQKKKTLNTKLLFGILRYALMNLIIISIVVGFYYFYAEIMESTDVAFALARSGAHMVDGDRIADYMRVVGTDEDGKDIYYSDDYYTEVMKYLDAIQSENDLVLFYYICVPQEDSLIYVWDANTADGHSPQGYSEVSLAEEKKSADRAFRKNPDEKISLIADPRWGNLLTAYSPVFDSSGEPVALVGVDLSVDHLIHKFLIYLLLILAAILVVTVISLLILFKDVNKMLLRPIEKLNKATKNIVGEFSGNSRFELEINTGDEMEELANSFRKMDTDLHEYFDQLTKVTADRERIHAELNVAKQIQADILPNVFPAFPDRSDFDIYAELYPSQQIGGDFYDFFLIDKDHLAMLVGDVAGEGIPAALQMVIVETLIKSRAMQGFSPAEVLQSVSEQMLAYNIEQYSYAWFAILELSSGKGIAVNAGHEHPILRSAGKRFEIQEYQHYPPVGAMVTGNYRDHGFRLEPGDCLFIYSDGVKDAKNEASEGFGRQRILEALNREPDATPSVLIQTVQQAVAHFSGELEQSDDLTMLCLKYYGPDGETEQI